MVAGVALACVAHDGAGASAASSVDLGRLPSTSEQPAVGSGADALDPEIVTRDGGVSSVYRDAAGHAHSLWIFGDTVIGLPGSTNAGSVSVLGATAAVSDVTPGRLPVLAERPIAGSSPIANVYPVWEPGAAFTCPTGTFGDTWERGATSEPDSPWRVLVSNWSVCFSDPPFTAIARRSGYAEIDTRTWTVRPYGVFGGPTARLPATQIIGAPRIIDGYLYSFISACRQASATCTGSGIYLARARWNRAGDWRYAAAYRWWDGHGWSTRSDRAASLIHGETPFLYELDVAVISGITGHAARLAMTVQRDGGGAFQLFYADTPTSWRPGPVSHVPDTCRGAGDLGTCRAINIHAELSTPSRLVYSWYSPGDTFGGHVRLASMPWR